MKPSVSAEDYAFLSPQEKAQVQALLTKAQLWAPQDGPQRLAYESEADIIGFGGAAGGGKTDLIIGKALNKHKRVAVFRLNGTEHTSFIDRLEEVIGNRDGYSGKTGIWRDVGPRKVQIELCSLPNPGDERKYRGRPHDLKAFDEATELPLSAIRFLLTWLRTTVQGQRCQALLCFNPPSTLEGRWVIDFFGPWLDKAHPNPAQPAELRWYAMVDGEEVARPDGAPFTHNGELITPQSRTFIPSKVTDNKYLMGTNYMTQLQSLPEPLRSQMLYGDFDAGQTDDPWQVIPTAWVEEAMARWQPKTRKPEMMALGVDVARGGADETIIARRHADWWFDEPLAYAGTATPDGPHVAGLVIAATRDRAPQHIDIIGVGASPYDFLNQSRQPVIGVDVRRATKNTDRSGALQFANLRSELVWKFRELLDPNNNYGVALPPHPRLKADLCAFRWESSGRTIKVLSKEEIQALIHRSPDYASAYFMAAIETPKLEHITGGAKTRDVVGRCNAYNPYDRLDKELF